jgi:hypothetical protein
MITLKYITGSRHQVYWRNSKHIGDFIRDVDGYFYYWANDYGCWSSNTLRVIAEKLEEINEPYEKEVEEYFKNNEE